jgi:hypothetical protein
MEGRSCLITIDAGLCRHFPCPHPQLHHDPPLLYDLGEDPGEKFNIAADHAKILDEIETIKKKHLKNLVPGEDQLTKRSIPG